MEEIEVNKAPEFLKVLCILSYVGIGFGILFSLYNLVMIDLVTQELAGTLNEMDKRNLELQLEKMRDYGFLSGLSSLAGNMVCLAGVLYMWRLKRIGFFTYTSGHVLTYARFIPFLMVLLSGDEFLDALIYLTIIVQILFSSVFIIMYGVHLKYLKT